MKKRIQRFIAFMAALSITSGALFAAYFSVNMAAYIDLPSDYSAVLILGCQVSDEEPGAMLKSRLDKALELLAARPDAICIASGGKGNGENISEAEAMRRYLTSHGIRGERILLEDRSTSTDENMRYSAEIMTEHGITNIMIVTSGFHQYRAELCAQKYAIKNAGHCSAKTDPLYLPYSVAREWAALFYTVFLSGSAV